MSRKMQRQDHEVAAGTLSQQAAGRRQRGDRYGAGLHNLEALGQQAGSVGMGICPHPRPNDQS